MAPSLRPEAAAALRRGLVLVAHPLALDAERRLDPRRQRALTRYYRDAGAGGLAVGVHTTQFNIRQPGVDLLAPVLRLCAKTLAEGHGGAALVRIAGVCGPLPQALSEARLASDLGYDLALVSLAGVDGDDGELAAHLRAVGKILPVFAFYLQPAVGGRPLGFDFWRRAADLESVVAVKVAPFDRYATLEAVRGVCASDRADDVSLYTGNDDHIVADLLTTFRFEAGGRLVEKAFAGGLLGQWAVGTGRAVDLLERVRRVRSGGGENVLGLLGLGTSLTDLNAAVFDVRNGFRGCIPGIHEVLRRDGLLAGTWCVDPRETLSPGQDAEIDRVLAAYPELLDRDLIAGHLAQWLEGGSDWEAG